MANNGGLQPNSIDAPINEIEGLESYLGFQPLLFALSSLPKDDCIATKGVRGRI